MKRALIVAVALVSTLVIGAPASGEPPPKGTTWKEAYFPSDDGVTMLHADIIRKKGLTNKDKQPVILTVSPYTNHAGSTTDYDADAEGPNPRFYDFLEVSDIIDRGYTYVIVDLPGFGGSMGCNDWGGVREQGAAKAAVEWAASQPWSTGKVGMMGKSYDAWTGLMAMAQKPKGLKAVVAMEPVYSGYRYLYNNGVRFSNSLVTGAGFQVYDAKPGSTKDDPQYNAYGAPQAWCYGVNYGGQQTDTEDSPYWEERNLLPLTEGSKIPLFLTQGFLETNTKQDAAFDFFNGLRGQNRAWYGQFDHYRGWEKSSDGDYLMGRASFVAEMVRFFDHHLKGKNVRLHRDPAIEVQDQLGRYRAEKQWPPSDMKMYRTNLRKGSYTDQSRNCSTCARNGIWTVSQPLKHDAWLAGEALLNLTVEALPRANIAANLYDIAPNGTATHITRGTSLLRDVGSQEVGFELYGQDWYLKKGHRIGVYVSDGNSDWWVHVPSFQPVTVRKATLALPFLTYKRTRFIEGGKTPTLRDYMRTETFDVPKNVVKASDKKFDLPGRMHARPRHKGPE